MSLSAGPSPHIDRYFSWQIFSLSVYSLHTKASTKISTSARHHYSRADVLVLHTTRWRWMTRQIPGKNIVRMQSEIVYLWRLLETKNVLEQAVVSQKTKTWADIKVVFPVSVTLKMMWCDVSAFLKNFRFHIVSLTLEAALQSLVLWSKPVCVWTKRQNTSRKIHFHKRLCIRGLGLRIKAACRRRNAKVKSILYFLKRPQWICLHFRAHSRTFATTKFGLPTFNNVLSDLSRWWDFVSRSKNERKVTTGNETNSSPHSL